MSKKLAISGALALLTLGTGCFGPTQVLVSQRYSGARVVRYTIEPTGQSTEKSGQLYNLRVRLCQAEGANDTQCQDSVLLENVQPRSVY